MAFKKITPSFSAAPQLTRDDVAAAAQAGFRSIVSSRPNGEEQGQPSAHEMARIAEEHGLAFAHVPIVPGKATDADADRMKEALTALPGPTLGFCRSGTRAATLWALAEASHADPETIVGQAKAAGYDLADLKPALARRSERTGK
ncbi:MULTISPECIES: TIGR01244 family sulfur transferase [Pseudomonadota]|jgi:uncharacterized protein (TIGR01244 family)|uniref:TIGR01244 family protein n=7 Tax=Sphingomonadaceae TaxID=41297 RepID=A0A285R1N4_9SPHN|nr:MULTISPECIES: TIGR01244 family sulfur transferase [Pseudomonadota]GLK22305.1 hypothetical protein GCM10017606_31330 [Microbacterium terregens]AXJ97325.1 TIGR01244 family phosphatase [Sphingomonas sp. FARSPH]KQO57179.1 hypothetical protein ASF14_17415 [Sphingomonas sp. Leaf257]MBB3877226.1 sulfide:quinone oxidoreductase [Sphingomonas aquatilis]MBB4050325.1 sulfide:quinone oxidoreductase [Sphingomonas zeae]